MTRIITAAAIASVAAAGLVAIPAGAALAGDFRVFGSRWSWTPNECRAPNSPSVATNADAMEVERTLARFEVELDRYRDCIEREAERDLRQAERAIERAVSEGEANALREADRLADRTARRLGDSY